MSTRSLIILALVALTFLVTLVCSARTWGDIQLFPSSRIPDNALSPKRRAVRRKIVLYHNFFRTKVQPTASNMLNMSWHAGAARKAQSYAERCLYLTHNPIEENAVPGIGTCGQNLFVSTGRTPWFFPIKSWFLEYKNFTYGSPVEDIKPIGHYTQMVWATSYKVGCGLAHCKGGPWGRFYNYVCHYCPIGNIDGIVQYPYKKGKPCSDCPDNCLAGSLCTNFCPTKDFFNNCDELTENDPDYCKLGYCNATCSCGDEKIHKMYPW